MQLHPPDPPSSRFPSDAELAALRSWYEGVGAPTCDAAGARAQAISLRRSSATSSWMSAETTGYM